MCCFILFNFIIYDDAATIPIKRDFLFRVRYMDGKKIIVIETQPSPKIITAKERKKRVITQQPKWNQALQDCQEKDCIENLLSETPEVNPMYEMAIIQIKGKIRGYLSQDKEKKLYCEEKFVNLDYVLSLFRQSSMNCYYCKEKTTIFYEYVREPNQWTLERIDNTYGHNCDNVVIACLGCNLRRRTMASERYVQTKAIGKVVKLGY